MNIEPFLDHTILNLLLLIIILQVLFGIFLLLASWETKSTNLNIASIIWLIIISIFSYIYIIGDTHQKEVLKTIEEEIKKQEIIDAERAKWKRPALE